MRPSPFSSIGWGLFVATLLVFAGSLLTATVLRFTSVSEQTLSYWTYGTSAIALLIGGFVSGRHSGQRGWYYGGVTGLLYGTLIWIIGFLGFDASFDTATLWFLVMAFLCAALGGILGVNLSRN